MSRLLNNPYSIAFYENSDSGFAVGRYLYWSERNDGNIYRFNLDLETTNHSQISDAVELIVDDKSAILNVSWGGILLNFCALNAMR